MTTKSRTIQSQIDRYWEEHGWDIRCQRVNRGYTLYWDDGDRFARLRPTGNSGEFEVLWWSEPAGRWRELGEFGAVFPLDEALDYLQDDPEHRFFDYDDDPNDVFADEMATTVVANHLAMTGIFLLAGICGGLMRDTLSGITGGAFGALIGLATWHLSKRNMLNGGKMVLCILVGVTVGAVGGGTNMALSGGLLGAVIGVMVGAASGLACSMHHLGTRVVGFFGGLLIGSLAVAELDAGFWQMLVPAFCAWLGATGLGNLMREYLRSSCPFFLRLLAK